MQLDTFKPTFLIQIEGETLSKDITQEITEFAFEDHEKELDVLELSITNRNLQFTDDPLFQEGNEIVARFGYVDALSPRKTVVIKDIDYDFPDSGDPTIRIKAYDKGFKLAGKENQKVWQKPPPGILYSEIAEEIALANELTPVVVPTVGHHLRVAQSNISDAQFLRELAEKARATTGDGATGYVFFVQDNELHFHPRSLNEAPVMTLEYFTDRRGLLRSFRPCTQSQGAKGRGTETRAVGVDPRARESVEHRANNETTPDRDTLGRRTYLVDGATGEGRFTEQQSGQIIPDYGRSEGFHEEPENEPAQDNAEGRFKEGELGQVEAVALTIGIPGLKAKENIEILGVGEKFSGVYYIQAVRHVIGPEGYSTELKLKKNALGKGAGDKAEDASGRTNEQEAPPAGPEAPALVTIDANTGRIL